MEGESSGADGSGSLVITKEKNSLSLKIDMRSKFFIKQVCNIFKNKPSYFWTVDQKEFEEYGKSLLEEEFRKLETLALSEKDGLFVYHKELKGAPIYAEIRR